MCFPIDAAARSEGAHIGKGLGTPCPAGGPMDVSDPRRAEEPMKDAACAERPNRGQLRGFVFSGVSFFAIFPAFSGFAPGPPPATTKPLFWGTGAGACPATLSRFRSQPDASYQTAVRRPRVILTLFYIVIIS